MRRECSALLGLIALFTAQSVSAQDLEMGRLLWISHCAACHGERGKPTLALTPDITLGEGSDISISRRMDVVRNGAGIMPPFEDSLREEFIVDIVAYMTTLYPKMSRPWIFWGPNFM